MKSMGLFPNGTLHRVIEIALGEVVTVEQGYNLTKYGKAFNVDGLPWCGSFCNWVFKEAGVKIPSVISTAAGAHAFKNLAKFREAPALGDLAFMDFPHDGVDRISHVGIVVGIAEGSITTIEGNTSGTGDQRNGGMVMIKTRALGTGSPVVGFGRCRFADFDGALPAVAEVITPKKKIGRLKK